MRELLVVSLFAFLLHCSWAGPSGIKKRAATCNALTGQVSADTVFHCAILRAPGGAAQLVVKSVDDQKWIQFTGQLSLIEKVDIMIDGSSITTLNLPAVATLSKSQLVVKSNPSLKEINIVLSSPSIISGLTIADNPELTTVKISATDTFAIKTGEVRITGNKALTTVDLPSATTYDITGLYVEANPLLSAATLTMFKGLNVNGKKEVQEEGECVFNGEIQDLGELKGCKKVKGDLKISASATGDATGVELTEVTGAIHLGSLGPEKLGFLNKAKVDLTKITSDGCGLKVNTAAGPYNNPKACSSIGQGDGLPTWAIGVIIAVVVLLVAGGAFFGIRWYRKKKVGKTDEETDDKTKKKKKGGKKKKGEKEKKAKQGGKKKKDGGDEDGDGGRPGSDGGADAGSQEPSEGGSLQTPVSGTPAKSSKKPSEEDASAKAPKNNNEDKDEDGGDGPGNKNGSRRIKL